MNLDAIGTKSLHLPREKSHHYFVWGCQKSESKSFSIDEGPQDSSKSLSEALSALFGLFVYSRVGAINQFLQNPLL